MKKKMLLFASIIICLLAVHCIRNTTCTAENKVKVTALKVTNLDYSNYYTMREHGTLQIKTWILPQNATNRSITWSSSDKTIARVSDNGFVTGVNRGFCKITGVTEDGSNKKVSFYVRVYSEKEFIYSYEWNFDNGSYECALALSSTGEYTMYDISAGEELESGLYTMDLKNKTITLNKIYYTGNTKKAWNYKIVSRSKMILSDGITQVTYTRNYRNKPLICTSTGLVYMPNGSTGAQIIGYNGTDTSIIIPSKISKREVSWDGGISGNTEVENVIISEGITSIYSCQNCTNLKAITIPDSVTYINDSAFENCTSLEKVHLPAGLLTIQKQIFKGCSSLKSIELPDQVVSVDSEAFSNCINLEALYFPKGIKEIEPDILKGCNQVVIYGYKNTCAEKFAYENNLTFIER